MQAAEEKEFTLVLSEFTKKPAAGFIRATGSIFFLPHNQKTALS